MGTVNVKEIKRRRLKKKLTMAEAARRAGWKAAQNWQQVEGGSGGNLRVKTLVAVAGVLGCKVDDLLEKP